jgi:hypothetical protein
MYEYIYMYILILECVVAICYNVLVRHSNLDSCWLRKQGVG